MVLRETLVLAVAGVGVGVGGALVATRTIASLLFGVTPHDLVTFAAVSFGMTAIAMIACCIPAARAARIDPMLALKIE
jgi:ABC-type antimicrobial peptide transport system permease subunit